MKAMKIVTVVLAACVAGMALAAKMSLSEARAQISACIADSKKMAEVVKQLSPADQVAFLSAVNEAISTMHGSNESKAAAYLMANEAAVSAADKANKSAMIAEVFATVPPEVLPVINERFAEDLLSIDSTKPDGSKVSNEAFTTMALSMMEKVNERCSSAENGAVRSTFAILMFVNASKNSIPDLTEKLVKTLPDTAQTAARSEWIPAALGEKQTKTYEPLLGSADNAGQMVANEVIIRLTGPQLLESMLGEAVEGTPLVNNSNNPDGNAIGTREAEPQTQPPADPTDEKKEPQGYQGQTIGE